MKHEPIEDLEANFEALALGHIIGSLHLLLQELHLYNEVSFVCRKAIDLPLQIYCLVLDFLYLRLFKFSLSPFEPMFNPSKFGHRYG